MPPQSSISTILVCGESEFRYPRDRTLIKALRSLPGVEILDLRYPAYPHKGVQPLRAFFIKLRRKFARWRIRMQVCRSRVAAVFVMKNNHELLEWLASMRPEGRRMPIFFDLWVSRALVAERNGKGYEAAKEREGKAICLADKLIATTEAYANYYRKLYRCDLERFVVVPLAAPQEWLDIPRRGKKSSSPFVVAYWGTFLKQHGLDVFLDAARILEDEPDIEFRLYGNPKNTDSRQMVSCLPTNTAHFAEIADIGELIAVVDSVDAGVGHLVPIHDAGLMLPNKAMEAMARGKPVIHIDAPFLYDEYGDPGSDGACVCFYAGGGTALAETVRYLKNNAVVAERIGRNARARIEGRHSVSGVENALLPLLDYVK